MKKGKIALGIDCNQKKTALQARFKELEAGNCKWIFAWAVTSIILLSN